MEKILPSMLPHKYKPLDQSYNSSSDDLPRYDHDHHLAEQHKASLARAWKAIYALLVLLGISIVANAVLFMQRPSRGHGVGPADASSFLGLEKNIPTDIPHDDRDIDDPMWDAPEYDWYSGWIAIDSKLAEQKGAPTSMTWPWDKSKSIYVFHSFHSLHCVFVLRSSLREFRDGANQTWPFGHVTHCLHVLREDITCYADDTPRYTGRLHAQANSTVLSSGVGQTRMCRDWGRLREYALEHSACYRRPTDRYVPLLDRYKSCPRGEEPWKGVE